jgi:NAD(P)-dependent dehydrogenase (short-subunit alcohol dehydrogenase family)
MAVARRDAELAQLAHEASVDYLTCDLLTEEGCAFAIDETRRRLGPIEILVNNAGLGTADEGSITETSTEGWRATMSVNLDAPFLLTREAAKDMTTRGWGRIVMVSSTAGEVGAPNMPAYCASKSGVLGLMRAVAQDLAPHGITCNAVLPGWVRTEMSERSAVAEASRRGIGTEAVWAERAALYEAGRTATAEEVAETISFLCSPESSGVSGQSITVALGGLW